jgi:hypothetical protein
VLNARVGWVQIDCADPDRLRSFWAAFLGLTNDDSPHLPPYGCLEPPASGGPGICFQRVPEPKVVKNRVHLDIVVDDLEAATTGGEHPDFHEAGWRWRTMADPEGNEYCLVPGATRRGEDPGPARRLRHRQDERHDHAHAEDRTGEVLAEAPDVTVADVRILALSVTCDLGRDPADDLDRDASDNGECDADADRPQHRGHVVDVSGGGLAELPEGDDEIAAVRHHDGDEVRPIGPAPRWTCIHSDEHD